MAITLLPNGYTFVPRPDWDSDADYPSGTVKRPVNEFYIHHTVTNPTEDPCADARTVERVLDARRLDGYSYLNHPYGVVLEFAGDKRGEHTGGHNSTSYAMAFIGNYDQMHPSLSQLIAAARTINLLRLKGDLVPRLEDLKILPHQAVKATACPGANILLPNLNGRSAIEWIRWFAHTGV